MIYSYPLKYHNMIKKLAHNLNRSWFLLSWLVIDPVESTIQMFFLALVDFRQIGVRTDMLIKTGVRWLKK